VSVQRLKSAAAGHHGTLLQASWLYTVMTNIVFKQHNIARACTMHFIKHKAKYNIYITK